MPKERYEIMRAHMPYRGSLGLDMMQSTCALQANIDFSDEADMVKKFRVSLALQPIATAQRYLPEISSSGDKRVLLIDGNPIPVALVRHPAHGDHRGNMNAGGKTEVKPITDRDNWICEQIGPALRDTDLMFAGIDVIGDYLTELNVTSPTGIREVERESDVRITEKLFDAISSKLA